MKKEKTSNVRSVVWKMLLGAVVGGILGGMFGAFHVMNSQGEGIGDIQQLFAGVKNIVFPGLVIVTVLSIVLEEVYYSKLEKVCADLPEAEDDEIEQLDYEEERLGAVLQGINILSQVICIALLACIYSFEDFSQISSLGAAVTFIICFFYDGCMQARYVKLLQRVHPEKRGDVSSMKFQEQWLASCDEAEKEVIYQSAYKAYVFASKCTAVLLLVTMFAQLLFNTGILAIIVVGIMYLILSMTYCKSCVDLKKAKIQR